MSEDRRPEPCVLCGGANFLAPEASLCGDCRRAEFCLGCGRDGAVQAARTAGGGRNEPAAWCGGCERCADCTGRAHCMRPMDDGTPRVHGACEGCLDGEEWICGACAECSECCECARAPPAVCTGCNLRPPLAPVTGAGLALCGECLQRIWDVAEAGAAEGASADEEGADADAGAATEEDADAGAAADEEDADAGAVTEEDAGVAGAPGRGRGRGR
jgi:hypothetical protein